MISMDIFDFTVSLENKTVIVVKEFSAKLSVVWDAYSNSEKLDDL